MAAGKPVRFAIALTFGWSILRTLSPVGLAQNPQMQQQVKELQQSIAANKQELAQFTWQEQQTVLIKGDVKKQELFQVRMGPDGKPQKTPLEPQGPPPKEHGLRGRIKERKMEEFEDYAKQIAGLAQGYTQPEPGRLQQLYQQGSMMIGSGGAPNAVRVLIQGYQKPGDSVALVFDRAQKLIQSVEISSYLDDPSDAVKISAQYAPLPGGPNHVSQMQVNGVSKQLTVEMQNSNYQRVSPAPATVKSTFGSQEPSSDSKSASGPAPQSADQIQALVAPIALYPDALVAQVLSGATFPDQIALAQNWLQEHKDLSGQNLMQEVNKQTWDPSVKALTQFPSVLDNMAKNLAWTSELGEVYHNQPKDVMDAVQALRAKAKDAGNLKTTDQIKVVQQSPQTIVIEPANPQVVYVPQYNPTVVYGTTYVVPSYTPPAADVAAAGIIGFGAGIAVGAMMSGGCCSWGWSSWSCTWHGGYVGYAGHPYYGSAAWHGAYGAYGYHGYGGYGAAAYHTPYGSAGAYHGYGAYGGYHTGGAYSNAWGAGTTHTGYGPDGSVHTGGSGYNAATGQAYHYGATSTRYGGTAYHGTTSTGQHYAGGTTASGEHWGGSSSGWGHNDGWSSRAASDRGWGSMHASGFSGFHGGFRR